MIEGGCTPIVVLASLREVADRLRRWAFDA
jgi:hypothetical protein